MAGATWTDDLQTAVKHTDVILTDGPGSHALELAPYQITTELLAAAPTGVRLAPCPPFLRGREVHPDVIAHPAFVGYEFKKGLLAVQQAVIAHCLNR
jgi:ornithine carbamoyltransferase